MGFELTELVWAELWSWCCAGCLHDIIRSADGNITSDGQESVCQSMALISHKNGVF